VKKNKFCAGFFGTFLNTACRRYTHRLRQRKLTEKESRLEDPMRPYICIKHASTFVNSVYPAQEMMSSMRACGCITADVEFVAA